MRFPIVRATPVSAKIEMTADVDDDGTYDVMAAAVGGYIDMTPISRALMAVVNDTGAIDGLPLNVPVSMMAGRPLFGDILICAFDPENPESQPPDMTSPDMSALGFMHQQWYHVLTSGGADGGAMPLTVCRLDVDVVRPETLMVVTGFDPAPDAHLDDVGD